MELGLGSACPTTLPLQGTRAGLPQHPWGQVGDAGAAGKRLQKALGSGPLISLHG